MTRAHDVQKGLAACVSPDKALYSFDLFDTLITRPVKRPAMVFHILDRLGVEYRLSVFGLIGFRIWRVLAERVARRLSAREDIDIFRIYRVLGYILKSPSAMLKQELAVELALIQPIPDSVATLRGLLAQGRRCCIVSDMYLPPSVIRRIVRRHVGEVDFLVSSREGLTKRSGGLFRALFEGYGIDARAIQHFGDNPHSDLSVPRALGMDACLLPALNQPGKAVGIYDAFCYRAASSLFQEVGHALVGPCCLEFARFIAEDARQRGLSRIIFAARDGYLLKEAFDSLETGIQAHYVRLSRRALYVSSFAVHRNYDYFFEGRVSATDFFSRLGLACPAELAGLDPSGNRARFIHHLEEAGFAAIAEADADVMRGYLQARGFSGKVGFVDLGWRGSLQSAVQVLCANDCNIHGYYFGTITDAVTHCGFYFQNGRPFSRCATVFQSLPIFEFLFTEPVHTLQRIRGCPDQTFEFDFVADEPDAQFAIREDIASGARAFFKDVAGLVPILERHCSVRAATLDPVLEKYLTNPSPDFIKAFEEVGHAEGFGGSKYGRLLPRGKRTLRGYRDSYWRAAYASNGGYLRFIHRVVYSKLGMWIILKRGAILRLLMRRMTRKGR